MLPFGGPQWESQDCPKAVRPWQIVNGFPTCLDYKPQPSVSFLLKMWSRIHILGNPLKLVRNAESQPSPQTHCFESSF